MEQRPKRLWFADASLEVLGGLSGVKRMFWRWNLPGEVVRRTVMNNPKMQGDITSVNLLEVTAAVLNANIMIWERGERPDEKGEAVLIRADNVSTVSWAMKCRGGARSRNVPGL